MVLWFRFILGGSFSIERILLSISAGIEIKVPENAREAKRKNAMD